MKESLISDKKRAAALVERYSGQLSEQFEETMNEIFDDAFENELLTNEKEQEEAFVLFLWAQIIFQKQIMYKAAANVGILNPERELNWLSKLIESEVVYEPDKEE